jgi:Zn finger protein HypA/HybF involved in hydrogenase expression
MFDDMEKESELVKCGDCFKEFYKDNENEKFCAKCNAHFMNSVDNNEGDFHDSY